MPSNTQWGTSEFRTPESYRHPDDRTPPYKSGPESNKCWMDRTPLGQWGEPEQVAYRVLFLASDKSTFMTGSELAIDDGCPAQ